VVSFVSQSRSRPFAGRLIRDSLDIQFCMSQRIGILGGTFNPVHLGHLIIAQMVAKKYRFNQVLFIPCYLPPHKYKQPRGLIQAKHRLQMLRRAIADNPLFKVSDIEIKRGGKSYSIDTIRSLQSGYPEGCKFYFIIGADTLRELSTWHAVNELVRLAYFVTVARPGKQEVKPDWSNIAAVFGEGVARVLRRYYSDRPLIGISSKEIREKIKRGESVKYLVPPSVEQYIIKHRLYQ